MLDLLGAASLPLEFLKRSSLHERFALLEKTFRPPLKSITRESRTKIPWCVYRGRFTLMWSPVSNADITCN